MKKFSLRRCLGDYTSEMKEDRLQKRIRSHERAKMRKRHYNATQIHCLDLEAKRVGQTKDIHTCQLCRKAYAVRPKSQRRVKAILCTDVTADVWIFDDTFLWRIWGEWHLVGTCCGCCRELSFLSRLQHHYFLYTRMRQTRRDLGFPTWQQFDCLLSIDN